MSREARARVRAASQGNDRHFCWAAKSGRVQRSARADKGQWLVVTAKRDREKQQRVRHWLVLLNWLTCQKTIYYTENEAVTHDEIIRITALERERKRETGERELVCSYY